MTRTSRRAGPSTLHAVVAQVLKQTAADARPLFMVQARWPSVVGRRLAKHAKPVSLRRGRLIVQVDRPGESYVLQYERPRVLGALQRLTAGRVEELVIRPGGGTSTGRHGVSARPHPRAARA